jgi:hypothetical protein
VPVLAPDRFAELRLALAALDRDEPLLDRDALLARRVDAADFARPDPPDFVFDPDALAELLLVFLRVETDLLVAIRKPLPPKFC